MSELWRETWYDGYEISNLGRLRSTRRAESRIVIGRPDKEGYIEAHIRHNGRVKWLRLHRLVASVWIGQPSTNLQVNHINGDKSDNRAENLEWVTNLENRRHAIETGLAAHLAGERHGSAKLTWDQVRQIRVMEETQDRIALLFGVSQSAISDIKRFRTWRSETVTYHGKTRGYKPPLGDPFGRAILSTS